MVRYMVINKGFFSKHPKSASVVLLVLFALVFTGCGFQLKGQADIPEEFSNLRLSGDDQSMIGALSEILKQNEVVVTKNDSAAEIGIVQSHFQKSVETFNDLGVATGYAYRYSVEYRIVDRTGTIRVPSEVIRQSGSLRYEVGSELELEHEENFLKQQMAHEIAGRIIRQFRWL
ncbi:MAG: hypothetical protein F4X92_02760 [Gammaproteobacteria bacterium]|nr:hypothetical protein [Gammaproteobacteria bacterium]